MFCEKSYDDDLGTSTWEWGMEEEEERGNLPPDAANNNSAITEGKTVANHLALRGTDEECIRGEDEITRQPQDDYDCAG